MIKNIKSVIAILPLAGSLACLVHAFDKGDGLFAIASSIFFVGFAMVIKMHNAMGP